MIKKLYSIFLIIICLCLIGCTQPHTHNYIDGVCSCGDKQETIYTVTFKDYDGTILKEQRVVKEESAIAPSAPTREGYKFIGWSEEFTKVTSDLIIVAQYEKLEDLVTVTFDTKCDYKIESIQVEKGNKINQPNDPIREGYKFLGWYYENEVWSFIGYTVTEDITLEAKWSEYIPIICTNDLSDLTIKVGGDLQLYFIQGNSQANGNLLYSISDTELATINEYGNIKALHEGVLYVTAVEKDNIDNKCIVEIIIEPIALEGLVISGPAKVYVGETVQYQVKFIPENCECEVVWSTSDESAAIIDENGILTALTPVNYLFIYAKSEDDPNILARKKIIIKENEIISSDYPDLQGYTIRIAFPAQGLYILDPFLDDYTQPDKEAKKAAWREVEDLFNCRIEVDAYPSSAAWGPSRWNYILQQAQYGLSDYDFLQVPDSQIPTFVDGGALIALSEFYQLYGQNYMSLSNIKSGTYKNKLYSMPYDYRGISYNNIDSVMYYNIGLLEQLQEVDPTLEEPAKIFNDGNWTYESFESYCKQVQDAMAKKFGETGVANSENQEYFAVSGWDSYWWAGLSSNDGEPLADVESLTLNLSSHHKEEAAKIVRSIYEKGYADPKQSVDGGVVSWKEERALFNTGNLWFVNDDNRWPSNMWGEDTRYGYVPWPRANDMDFEDIKVALGGINTLVMPIGRDYSGYGDDCTAKNIYRAVAEMLQRTKKYYYNNDNVWQQEKQNEAIKMAHSAESQKAYLYIQELIKQGYTYYDPLSSPYNPVGSLYTNKSNRTTIKGAVTQFCAVRSVETWEEAIAPLLPVLQESLRKAFS